MFAISIEYAIMLREEGSACVEHHANYSSPAKSSWRGYDKRALLPK
jgi:hypothetical protein